MTSVSSKALFHMLFCAFPVLPLRPRSSYRFLLPAEVTSKSHDLWHHCISAPSLPSARQPNARTRPFPLKWGNKRKQKRSARTLSCPTRPLVTFKRGRERQSAPASRPRRSASTAGLAQRRGWKWGRDGRRLFFHTRNQGPRSFPLTPERRSQRRPRAGSSSKSPVSGRGWGIGSPATSFGTPHTCWCIL